MLTLAAGAGHGEAGDAPQQGPAREPTETLPAQPRPANKLSALSEAEAQPSDPVVVLAGRPAPATGLVTVRPKPEKRKNAKERAKAKFAKDKIKDDVKDDAKDGTTPMTATAKSTASKKAADKPGKAKKAKSGAEPPNKKGKARKVA